MTRATVLRAFPALPIVAGVGFLLGLPASPALGQAAITAILEDIYEPSLVLIQVLCLLIGAILVLRSVFRLIRRSQDRFGPGLHGTALMAFAGVVLVNLAIWLEAGGRTLFGQGRPTEVVLSQSGGSAPGSAVDYDALLQGVVVILFVVGVVAVIRGVVLLPAAADGRAGVGQAFCHIVGGLACCNLPGMLRATQATIGVDLLTFQ